MTEGSQLNKFWSSVVEDPMTGLPNFLALINDMKGGATTNRLTVAEFDIKMLGIINREFGTEEGDRTIMEVADELVKAAAALNISGSRVYRLGGDEFCVVLPGLSHADDLIADLRSRGVLSRVRHTIVTRSCESKSLEEVFVEIWPLLIDSLQSQAGARGGQMKRVTRLLVDRVRETVEMLRVSREQAYTDDISGLPNQRAARHVIREHISKRGRKGEPLGLLFADGDNLKTYNENLGYASGNEMIRRLGNTISAATAPGELVARWLSGDEFMIMIPGCGKKEALDKATAICRGVESQSRSWPYPVTISIGVASFPEDGSDLESLVAKAEEANAQAKRLGKNRVHGA